jgi:hypothetical protein
VTIKPVPRHLWLEMVRNQRLLFAREVVEIASRDGMLSCAKRLGITRQRVHQIIQRYEEETGEQVPRYQNVKQRLRKPLVKIACLDCKTTRYVTDWYAKLLKSNVCRDCSYKRHRLVSDVEIEAIIQQKLNGSNWFRLALKAGYPANGVAALPAVVFRYLCRNRREADIAALWPNGLPAYLRKQDRRRQKDLEAA